MAAPAGSLKRSVLPMRASDSSAVHLRAIAFCHVEAGEMTPMAGKCRSIK
jgi:hypothetical protein